jgi:hypothetical protein
MNAETFYLCTCTTCGHRALPWLDVDEVTGGDQWRCSRCDAPITEDAPRQPVPLPMLKVHGYQVDEGSGGGCGEGGGCSGCSRT